MSDVPAESVDQPPRTRKRILTIHRFALLQALLIVLVVLVALPVAFNSMGAELLGRQERLLYRFPDGQPLPDNDEDATARNLSYLNIAAEDLDEEAGSLTFVISGHRACGDNCAEVALTFFSIEDNAHVRRALPPSVSLTLEPTDVFITQTVQLPVRGQPGLYPFDSYQIWLGLAGSTVEQGRRTQLTAPLLSGHALLTTQNQLRDFIMTPPVAIDPNRVSLESDPVTMLGVQQLVFNRPIHSKILAVLLMVLVAASALIAVALREMTDLLIGIGSLILAIWGVRSVLVPSGLSVVTSVDLALSLVILVMLLGISLRAALYFRKTSELPKIRLPGRHTKS
jgi:hypothetical protein